MRKGYTLIEIMIVIVIISILMTVTMRFGSNRINDLKHQSTKEQFFSAYDKLYSQNMTSNYHNWIRFESLQIDLTNWSDQIYYGFDGSGGYKSDILDNYVITGLMLDSGEINNVELNLKPYTIWCDMINNEQTWTILKFDILVDGQKSYCFTIKSDTCKLIEKICN